MSLELCVLASGSSGNCAIVRTPAGAILVDAGIGPRTVARRLEGTGLALADLRAICLTHLDGDHFTANWAATIVKLGLRVYCHARRVGHLMQLAETEAVAPLIHSFDHRVFQPLDGLAAHSVAFEHDEHGSHGFLLEGFGQRIGYATDLGRVPAELTERFLGVDILAMESNYDPAMQLASPRPYFLKQRIMGGSGHLSNQQAFDAVRLLLNKCEQAARPLPSHIALLHRSRQCNCPRIVRKLFERDARIAARLTLCEQGERSEWMRPRAVAPLGGEQLALAWG